MFTKMFTKMFTTKKNTPAPGRVIPLSDGNLEQVVGGLKGSLPAPPPLPGIEGAESQSGSA